MGSSQHLPLGSMDSPELKFRAVSSRVEGHYEVVKQPDPTENFGCRQVFAEARAYADDLRTDVERYVVEEHNALQSFDDTSQLAPNPPVYGYSNGFCHGGVKVAVWRA